MDSHVMVAICSILIAAIIAALVNLAAFARGYGKLQAWVESRAQLEDERWDAIREDMTQVKKRVGLENGDGVFVPSRFCADVHRAMQVESVALRTEVQTAIRRGDDAIMEGRVDREAIKQRLARVEAAVGGPR